MKTVQYGCTYCGGLLLAPPVHYVAVFYCDRLKDRAVVIPAVLYGLQALVGMRGALFPGVVEPGSEAGLVPRCSRTWE